MKILILSCNTGEGHNAAGRAVQEAARLRGHQADMLDMFLCAGERTSRIVGGAYVGLVKHLPQGFGFIYNLGMHISSDRRKSPVYYANSLLAKRLSSYIRENGYDLVVTSHLFPAETLTYMKRKGLLDIPAAAVATDYTCIPFWEETDLDAYFTPDETLTEEFVRRGVPAKKLYPYGIPVSQDFVRETDRTSAREKLNLPLDVPTYLVMSGSMGFGKLIIFSARLALRCTHGEHIIIICGNNKRIQRTLREEFRTLPHVHVLGYTKHVALYMDACDVIFTKPGGLTSTEALVKNIPIVHTAPIPGCETANRNFFRSRHLSVSAKNMREQISLGMQLTADQKLYEKIRTEQQKHRKPNAAIDIVKKLETMV